MLRKNIKIDRKSMELISLFNNIITIYYHDNIYYNYIYICYVCQVMFVKRGQIRMVRNRIREFRERLNISQVELSRRARVASPNLSSLERGKLAPWPRIQHRLARALKTTLEELFPEE